MLKGLAELISSRYGSKKGFLRYWFYHSMWRSYTWAAQRGHIDQPKRLVFICKGNICRSALAVKLAEQYGLPAVSFGLDTRDGKEAAPAMVEIGKAMGIDLSSHGATRVEHYSPQAGDLVCLMEPAHYRPFMNSCTRPPPAITLLGLWHPSPSAYIHDPLCCGPDYFAYCAGFIKECVEALRAHGETVGPSDCALAQNGNPR